MKKFFDVLTATFYDLAVLLVGINKNFRRMTAEIAGIKEGDKVLDVGCGTGTLTIEEKLLAKNGYVCGIDSCCEMIKRARKNANAEKVDIDFRIAKAEKIPYKSDYFDVVTCSFLMHHLEREKKREVLKEIYRVLKPGCHFLLVDFGKQNPLQKLGFHVLHLHTLHTTRENLDGKIFGLLKEYFASVDVVKSAYGIDFISSRK